MSGTLITGVTGSDSIPAPVLTPEQVVTVSTLVG